MNIQFTQTPVAFKHQTIYKMITLVFQSKIKCVFHTLQ